MPAEEFDRWMSAPELGSDKLLLALTETAAEIATRVGRLQQSLFLRTHSSATGEPASGWRTATGVATVRRTKDLHQRRLIAPGAMRWTAISGRTYVNANGELWQPGDAGPREIVIRSTAPGEVGNLDFLADEDGLLTREGMGAAPNTVDYIELADLRAGRAADGATILPAADLLGASVIRDSGLADQFLPQHVNLYLEIVDSDAPANIGRVLRVLGHTSPLVEFPAGSSLYPTAVAVDDAPSQEVSFQVWSDDGGVFTDQTAAAADDVPDDVTLMPTPATPGDAIYIGSHEPFIGVRLAITTPAIGSFDLRWQRWTGGSWQTFLPANDATMGYSTPGESTVIFPDEPAWTPNTVNGVTGFWLRVVVANVFAVTQEALAAGIRLLIPQRLLAGSCHWIIHDWISLGFVVDQVTAPSGGRDDTLSLYALERGAPGFQAGETDDALRERISELADVATPGAIRRAVARALEPYGMDGYAVDATDIGIFFDLDAFDYYESGDIYPDVPWKVLTSISEAHGWFWVFVPCLGDGEWGTSFDLGPIIYLDDLDYYLGPAFDFGFFDGEATTANAVYSGLYDTINTIRAAGFGFTMFRDCSLNKKKC